MLCAWLITSIAQAGIVPRLNQGESLTITTIGTSLSSSAHSFWFAQLGQWLNARYPGKTTLFNEAVSGSASKYTAAYTAPDSGLDVQLAKALAHGPDAIFIEFTMNDAWTQYGISQQASKNNLQTMIDRIDTWASDNDKNVDIVVQTMNNCIDMGGADMATDRPDLADYYQGYRDVAAANGLLLIDHYPNWMNLYDSQPDHATWLGYMDGIGIHPNALGTENIIMPEIQRILLAQVPEPSGIVMLSIGLLGIFTYAWQKMESIDVS